MEEREDNRVEEASSVDILVNWSVDGSEERTVERRAEGERDFGLRRVVNCVRFRGEGGGEF